MKRNIITRCASVLLFAVGVLLLFVGVRGNVVAVRASGFDIKQPEREITGVQYGTPSQVTFIIENPGWRDIRVVGLAEC